MLELTFVTGNAIKFATAGKTFGRYGIQLTQAVIDIDEVQSEDVEYIARRKAEAAYSLTGKPVIVADDNWSIPALNGFPGPYMKSINHWLSAENLLDLTRNLQDRKTFLTQTLVYKDEKIQKIFKQETPGEILHEARGGGHEAWAQIVSMQGDDGKTIAEMYLLEGNHDERSPAKVWHEFAKWYQDYAK